MTVPVMASRYARVSRSLSAGENEAGNRSTGPQKVLSSGRATICDSSCGSRRRMTGLGRVNPLPMPSRERAMARSAQDENARMRARKLS